MKYKSPLITTAQGSIGGLNASNNKGGQYFRSKPNPKNTTSGNRDRARSSIGALSNAWQKLSLNQRQGWEAYGQNVLIEVKSGPPRNLNGYHHFIRSNIARFPIFAPDPILGFTSNEPYVVIEDAPTIFSLPPPLITLQTALFLQTHGGIQNTIFFALQADIVGAPVDPPRGNWVTFYVSKPYNVGKSSYHQGFTYQGFVVYPEFGETPLSNLFPTQYTWPSGGPFKISAEFVVTLLDGRCTNPQRVTAEFP